MTISYAITHLTDTFFLVAARIAGMVVTAPMISSSYIPAAVRVGLTVLLAAAVAPGVRPVETGYGFGVLFGLQVVVEFGVGALIGLVLAVFLAVFGIAGQLITYQMGVGLAVAAEPGLLSTGSFLSEWTTLMALFVFVAAGGPELLVQALYASFQAVPVDAIALPVSAFGFVVGIVQAVLIIALLVALPVLTAGVVVNLTVGILSRAFPQINAYFLALPANLGVGLLVFWAGLGLLFGVIPQIWHEAWLSVSRLLVYLEGRAG